MTQYKNLGGNSGVIAYACGPGFIQVQFSSGKVYLYTEKSAGAEHIAAMKDLAAAGRGLNGYIMRHVREGYQFHT